ncbi:MAG: right-handed parallel beta-helix repeat-containing protein [Kiritimatiellia bacterium]
MRILAGMMIALFCGMAIAADYYVATNGNDFVNDGMSLGSPFRGIGKAAGLAQPGDTIHIRGGNYRELIIITNFGLPGQPITFKAYENERPVLKGSAVVTGWAFDQDYVWYRTNWPINPQQVFDDGAVLQQIGLVPKHPYYIPVGTNREDMTQGSFFYDTNTLSLYVWLADNSDPNGSIMEASTNRYIFNGDNRTNSWLVLENLTFRHSNSCTYTSGLPGVFSGGNALVSKCDIQWCDLAGLSLGFDSRATGCVLACNGVMGGGMMDNSEISSCLVVSNGYRSFLPGWGSGGLKTIPYYGVVSNCTVAWNKGVGIWFDYCRSGGALVVCHNYVYDNAGEGIMIEVSKNARVYNNLVVNNGGRSILITSAESNHVYNNTIIGARGSYAVSLYFAPTRYDPYGNPWPMRGNRFYNNIIYLSLTNEISIREEDGSNVVDNIVDHNCYFTTNGMLAFGWNRISPSPDVAFNSLSNWTAATGMDSNSIVIDPRFVNALSNDFHLAWDSPCIDAGATGMWLTVSVDGDYQPRIFGAAPDLGYDERSLRGSGLILSPTNIGYTLDGVVSGYVYALEFSSNLLTGGWMVEGGPITSSTPSIFLSDTNSARTTGFYRAKQL